MSAEPSMEEILSSIKRIIAEEGDSATSAARQRRPQRPMPPRSFQPSEVLELSDTVPPLLVDSDEDEYPATAVAHESPAPMTDFANDFTDERPMTTPESILSPRTAEATRGPLDALSRMVVKPDAAGSDTLEALVRELLRPMLREWLDAKLPELVEQMVAREIARITGHR